ncbi:MAG: hypothetical protein Q9184_005041 [Pyrenodesmia sp. 2 TL-2023]
MQEVSPQSDNPPSKRPRLTQSQQDCEKQSAGIRTYEQIASDNDSSHLPIPSSPSTLAAHSSPPPSPSTFVPAAGLPEPGNPPLTSQNLHRLHIRTPSQPSSGLVQHLDKASEANPLSLSDSEEKIGPDWIVGTESESEEKFGPDWIAASDSEREPQIGWDWLEDTDNEPLTGKAARMSVNQIRLILNRNRLFVKDPDAEIRGQTLIDKAKDIIDQRRGSSMEDETAQEIKESMAFHSTKNEKTMLINLWQLLVNKTRFVKKRGDDGDEPVLTAAEENEAAVWIQRAWLKEDNLFAKWDADFLSHTIPEICKTDDEGLNALLETVPRVAKPKPDLAMGFDQKEFSSVVLEVLEKFARSVTIGQFLTFFSTEAKGPEGTMEEAENQNCRGGAAQSKNQRDFWKATDTYLHPQAAPPDATYPRPDRRSISFSLAVTPQLATLFVHWAEELDAASEQWQQSKLRSYRLEEVDDLRLLRTNLDNIFDWGCASMKKKIVDQCQKVAAHMAGLDASKKATADKAVKDMLEGPAIKRQKKTHGGGE